MNRPDEFSQSQIQMHKNSTYAGSYEHEEEWSLPFRISEQNQRATLRVLYSTAGSPVRKDWEVGHQDMNILFTTVAPSSRRPKPIP